MAIIVIFSSPIRHCKQALFSQLERGRRSTNERRELSGYDSKTIILNTLKSSSHIIYRGTTPASEVARNVKRIPNVFKIIVVCHRVFSTSKSIRRKRRIERDQVHTGTSSRRLARELKGAEINHKKIPTCKSDRSDASTRESWCYKINKCEKLCCNINHQIQNYIRHLKFQASGRSQVPRCHGQ